MKVRKAILLLVLGISILSLSLVAQEWSLKAEYAESCCCAIPCGCPLGSVPSRGHCHGNGVLEIENGHMGNVKLDGLKIAYSLSMGEWIKYTVSETASDEQLALAPKIIAAAFGEPIPDWEIVALERGAIGVERTGSKIRFSTPDSNTVIEMMEGYQGEPVKILNLPVPMLANATQYQSIKVEHKGGKRSFEYSGTNALVSKVYAHGRL